MPKLAIHVIRTFSEILPLVDLIAKATNKKKKANGRKCSFHLGPPVLGPVCLVSVARTWMGRDICCVRVRWKAALRMIWKEYQVQIHLRCLTCYDIDNQARGIPTINRNPDT